MNLSGGFSSMPQNHTNPLQLLAERIYCQLAGQFPVCCASDEFYFFPQVEAEAPARWGWDDLTPEAVSAFASSAALWQAELQQLGGEAGRRWPPSTRGFGLVRTRLRVPEP